MLQQKQKVRDLTRPGPRFGEYFSFNRYSPLFRRIRFMSLATYFVAMAQSPTPAATQPASQPLAGLCWQLSRAGRLAGWLTASKQVA